MPRWVDYHAWPQPSIQISVDVTLANANMNDITGDDFDDKEQLTWLTKIWKYLTFKEAFECYKKCIEDWHHHSVRRH